MGLLSSPHARRLEALRQVRHVMQGESPYITFLYRYRSTGELLPLLNIDSSWSYSDRDVDGNNLPPEVAFELQVAEEVLTVDEVKRSAAIQHGNNIFSVVNAPIPPAGLRRFWRFWLRPLEEAA